MTIQFRASFSRDLKTIRDAGLSVRIQNAIASVQQSATLRDVPNLIKLQGGGDYYRLRVGDYRLGLSVQGDAVIFVRCLDRREIYKHFP